MKIRKRGEKKEGVIALRLSDEAADRHPVAKIRVNVTE